MDQFYIYINYTLIISEQIHISIVILLCALRQKFMKVPTRLRFQAMVSINYAITPHFWFYNFKSFM